MNVVVNMKPIKVIKDPEAFQLLANETRKKMVTLLRVKEMTVSQLAQELNITPQAVYHHIKKLQKGDLVEVVREERQRHLIKSYYRATAECFVCTVGTPSMSTELAEEQANTVLNALGKLGFNLEYDEDDVSQLIEVQRVIDDCCVTEKYGDKIASLDDVDFNTKRIVQEYAEILSMTNNEFADRQTIKKKFRNLLVSLIKK